MCGREKKIIPSVVGKRCTETSDQTTLWNWWSKVSLCFKHITMINIKRLGSKHKYVYTQTRIRNKGKNKILSEEWKKMLTMEGTAFYSLTDTKMVPLSSTNGVYCLSYLLKSKETRDKHKTQKCLFHRLRCYTWKGPCNPFCAFSANHSRIQSAVNLCEIQTFLKNKTDLTLY